MTRQTYKMEQHGSSVNAPADTTFVSITLVRALAIAGIIVENFVTSFSWKADASVAGILTFAIAVVAGSFVHVFFVLSGYGLTQAWLRKERASWGMWARKRFVKIIVPYWIAVVITFALANLVRNWAPDSGQSSYSWMTLLSYLTFLRNFYEPGWMLNWTLWFMPVLIGLYAFFPVLIQVMQRAGVTALIVLSLLIGNAAIAACVYWGYPINHQAALPLFFVDEFALGMAMAWITFYHPGRLTRLMDVKCFLLGLAVYTVAGLMSLHAWLGTGSSVYNDLPEAIGLLMILSCVCRWLSETFPRRVTQFLGSMSERSYAMYLIHGPIILYILKPLVGSFLDSIAQPLALIPIACVFVLLMYAMAEGISRLANKLAPASPRPLPARPG
jgi:peptidoglycan/LPS O-acetylase OafA/YrhL